MIKPNSAIMAVAFSTQLRALCRPGHTTQFLAPNSDKNVLQHEAERLLKTLISRSLTRYGRPALVAVTGS